MGRGPGCRVVGWYRRAASPSPDELDDLRRRQRLLVVALLDRVRVTLAGLVVLGGAIGLLTVGVGITDHAEPTRVVAGALLVAGGVCGGLSWWPRAAAVRWWMLTAGVALETAGLVWLAATS
ncbi:hypothetical protein [Dactylosporangium sp. NPDC000521]|uniref:hypothetical protein n=1 Tax=Dactylosporangium sp. NPDC000521 TaxID=3363975 RepID=UPI0036C76B29